MSRRRRLLALAGLALVAGAGLGAAAAAPPATDGEAIYLDGTLADGRPIAATALGEVEVSGVAASCAGCHRRSGYGSVEGGLYAPPITGPTLFAPRRHDRAELFRRLYQDVQPRSLYSEARDPRMRPAYDAASLATALAEGVDPAGRRLDPLMPRYRLSDEAMASLVAYLGELGAADDPGVDAGTIHFATVFTPDADPAGRRAVEAVTDAFVERKNQNTRDLLARPGASPLHHDEFRGSYRLWRAHRWGLHGEPESWPAQLDALYERQPVFAVLGGLGTTEWRPVHDFCEARELPCLFPQVDVPGPGDGGWAVYLSPGLPGEGAVVGSYLESGPEALAAGERVVQVYRTTVAGRAPARALASALEGSGFERIDVELAPGAADIAEVVERRVAEARPAALVLWLDGSDLARLDLARLGGAGRIVLSRGLVGDLPAVDPVVRDRVRIVHPRTLPGREPPRIHRVRAWLRSRGVSSPADAPAGDETLRLNAHFVLTVTDHALHHLVERFSRHFFLESVEHETENALSPGVYPRLSLGPGQRYGSKGGYVVRFVEGSEAVEPVGGWIVPGA